MRADARLVRLLWAHVHRVREARHERVRLPGTRTPARPGPLRNSTSTHQSMHLIDDCVFYSQKENNYVPYNMFHVRHIGYQLCHAVNCTSLPLLRVLIASETNALENRTATRTRVR